MGGEAAAGQNEKRNLLTNIRLHDFGSEGERKCEFEFVDDDVAPVRCRHAVPMHSVAHLWF
jgi:hypothetical protein